MKIVTKDLLSVTEGVIFHQVNCQMAMNSGIAKAIREKWPIVYGEYLRFSRHFNHDFERLGQVLFVEVEQGLHIANIFGQLNYGYDGKRYTDYSALNSAFRNAEKAEPLGTYFPYNFGACRGGGDFKIIGRMIEYYFPEAILCKFP